jgi:hypothetical protein
MLRLSTGLVKAMMDTGSFKASLEGGAGFLIDIYTGPRPAAADDAISSGQIKLVTISNNGAGTGMHFEATAPAGVLPKAIAELWSGAIVANGTAAWFRARLTTDTGINASTTEKRCDGTIAVAGGDLNLENLNCVLGAPFFIGAGTFTLPTGV